MRPRVRPVTFRRALSATAALAAWPLVASPTSPQDQPAPVLSHLADVKRLPGPVVAEAKLPAPETAMGITGYRLRHVALPRPHRLALPGWTKEVSEGWHVTVTFDRPLKVRDQGISLLIDGRWCGALQPASDLKAADTVCFDAALIREGAALGVTYLNVPALSEGPEAERALGPGAAFPNEALAVHYASARLHLQEPR